MSWLSKRQTCVTLSTGEAEYVAGSTAAREAVWLRSLVRALRSETGPVTMQCDTESAIAKTKNTSSSTRTKHIDVAYLYVRERIGNGELVVSHVPSKSVLADGLTKALPVDAAEACRAGIEMVVSLERTTPPEQTFGE